MQYPSHGTFLYHHIGGMVLGLCRSEFLAGTILSVGIIGRNSADVKDQYALQDMKQASLSLLGPEKPLREGHDDEMGRLGSVVLEERCLIRRAPKGVSSVDG